jgi:hypothetical protein
MYVVLVWKWWLPAYKHKVFGTLNLLRVIAVTNHKRYCTAVYTITVQRLFSYTWTHTHTDGRTDRQTDRETNRKTDGRTDRQTDGVHWTHLAHDRDQCRGTVNMVMNFRVLKQAENVLTTWATIGFSRTGSTEIVLLHIHTGYILITWFTLVYLQ